MRDILFVLFLTIIIGFACPAANAEIQKTGELKKRIEIVGMIAGIGEDSLLVAVDPERSLFVKGITNLGIYHFPMLAAAEWEQPIYIQFRSIGNGNCAISFLRFVKRPLQ